MIEEAVIIRRRLADSRPNAFLPDLATSLDKLAYVLSALGRDPEAHACALDADLDNLRIVRPTCRAPPKGNIRRSDRFGPGMPVTLCRCTGWLPLYFLGGPLD